MAGALGSKEKSAIEEQWRKQNWEQGNIDFTGRDSFDNIWQKIMEAVNKPKPESGKPASKEIASQAIPEKEKAECLAKESSISGEPAAIASMVMGLSEKTPGESISNLVSSNVLEASQKEGLLATSGVLMGMPALPAETCAKDPAKPDEPSALTSLITAAVSELPKQAESAVTGLLMGLPALPVSGPTSEPPKPEDPSAIASMVMAMSEKAQNLPQGESAITSLVSSAVSEVMKNEGSGGVLVGMPASSVPAAEPAKPEEPSTITPAGTPKQEEPSALASMVMAMSEKAQSLLEGGAAIANLITSTVTDSPKQEAGVLVGMPAMPVTPPIPELPVSEKAGNLPHGESALANLVSATVVGDPKQEGSAGILIGMPALPAKAPTEQHEKEESTGISGLISAAAAEVPNQDPCAVAGPLMGMPAVPVTAAEPPKTEEATTIASLVSAAVEESPLKEGTAAVGLLMGMPVLPPNAPVTGKVEEPSAIASMVMAMSEKAPVLAQGESAIANMILGMSDKTPGLAQGESAIANMVLAMSDKSPVQDDSGIASLISSTITDSPKQEGAAGILEGAPALLADTVKPEESSAIASLVKEMSEKTESLPQGESAIADLVATTEDAKNTGVLAGMPAAPATEYTGKEGQTVIGSLITGTAPQDQKKTESPSNAKQQAPQPPPKNGKQKKGQQPEPTIVHPLADSQITSNTPPTSPEGIQTKVPETQPGTPIVTAPTPPVSPMDASKVDDPLTAQLKADEATGSTQQPTPPKRKGKTNEKQPQKTQGNGGKAKGKK